MVNYYIHIPTDAAVHYANEEFGHGNDWAAEFSTAAPGGGEGRIVLPGCAVVLDGVDEAGTFKTRRAAEAQAARINECLAYENGRRGHKWGGSGQDGRLGHCIVVAR